METPSTKSQAHWQIEKLARWTLGCRRLEEIQKKSTWPHQVFTSAARVSGKKVEPGIQIPTPELAPVLLCDCEPVTEPF